jgi:outer membrane protein
MADVMLFRRYIDKGVFMRILTLLCCFLLASVSFAKETKIAAVDMQKLFRAYPGEQKAEKKFTAMAKLKDKELASEAEELKALEKELKNKDVKDRNKKEKDFKKKLQAFEKKRNEAQKELGAKQREMSIKVSDEVKALIAIAAKKAGVNMVIDSEKVVYEEVDFDLTDEVLKLYPKSTADEKDADSDSK